MHSVDATAGFACDGRVLLIHLESEDSLTFSALVPCACAAGATGGFAGGERGLLSYIESGELRLRKPGQPGGQPMSPLSIAFLVLVAGSGAAVLLSNVYDLGAGAFYPDALQVGAY